MSKPAFFTQPLIHVTGHEGSLSVFLSALIYHAVNPGVPAPLPNCYNYSWFGVEAQPGGYHYEWIAICAAMNQNPNDPVAAANESAADWISTGKNHVIESTRPEAVMEQLFGTHKHVMLYSEETDRYQLAYNYIQLDCIARKWQGFETIVADLLSPEELYELFAQPNHLDNPTVKKIIKAVGNSMYVNTLDPNDEPVIDSLNLIYAQYANPANVGSTIKQITDYLGNLVVVSPDSLEKTLLSFLQSMSRVDYDSFLQ